MHSEHLEFSINPLRHWAVENIVLRLTKSTPEVSEPEMVRKVWGFLQEMTGESILGARAYTQKLRSLGIESRLNEEMSVLQLGTSVRIPVYTRDGYFEMCEANGHSIPLLPLTDELLIDENQLGFALYEYCFGMPLDKPHGSRLVMSTWRHCIDSFRRAMEGKPRYSFGVYTIAGDNDGLQRKMEIPREIFDKLMATGIFQPAE